jgi:hypothetical protein
LDKINIIAIDKSKKTSGSKVSFKEVSSNLVEITKKNVVSIIDEENQKENNSNFEKEINLLKSKLSNKNIRSKINKDFFKNIINSVFNKNGSEFNFAKINTINSNYSSISNLRSKSAKIDNLFSNSIFSNTFNITNNQMKFNKNTKISLNNSGMVKYFDKN